MPARDDAVALEHVCTRTLSKNKGSRLCVCVCVCVCVCAPWDCFHHRGIGCARGKKRTRVGEACGTCAESGHGAGDKKVANPQRSMHALCKSVLNSQSMLNARVHTPGIEPGPAAWKAVVLPLHHVCAGFNGCKHTSLFCSLGKLVTNSPTVGIFLSSGWRRGRAERRHGDQSR